MLFVKAGVLQGLSAVACHLYVKLISGTARSLASILKP